jgi:hypothetical protein
MQDRPDAPELAAAVAQFLFEVVRPAVPPELRFPVLIAANTCAILAREQAAGDAARSDEIARMAQLGAHDTTGARAAQEEVAQAIRAGELDDRWDEAVAVLRESVRAKLAVANPGYDAVADDGR